MRDGGTCDDAAPARLASSEIPPAPRSGIGCRSFRALGFHDAAAVVEGTSISELPKDAATALREVAHWLMNYVSQPHPALGRSGEVCPWTRRTLDLRRLLLAPIGSDDAAEVDAIVLELLERFSSFEPTSGMDASFRSMIGVFYRLTPTNAASFIVAAHARLKPTFLDRGLMLGEFYPTCEKPGLHNPNFKALRAPVPLLVVRSMVEADVEFLLDRDEFVEAYLRTHGSRGLDRLVRVLAQRPGSLASERRRHLLGRVEEYRKRRIEHESTAARVPREP